MKKWIDTGVLRGYRIGGVIRVKKTDLYAALKPMRIPREARSRGVVVGRRRKPPQYRKHATGQAYVVLRLPGKEPRHVYLGKFATQESQRRYQVVLKEWEKSGHRQAQSDGGRADGQPEDR